MRELRKELLVEYVDERTPGEAPPFDLIEQAVGRQRRRRNLLVTATAAIAVAGAVVATADLLRAEEQPVAPQVATPVPGNLDDGPPPAEFKVGSTLLVLRGETQVSAVRFDPRNPAALVVEVPRDRYVAAACVPNTVVRILSQDATSVRVAAYSYSLAEEQSEGRRCQQPAPDPVTVHLDLRRPLDGRTVYAGSTGNRTLLN